MTTTQTIAEQYCEEFSGSLHLAEKARTLFPGGVTHDLRSFTPFPICVERAEGAYKWDVDGRRLIDYWSGHGALLLGHSHPAIVEAVQSQIELGTHPGACHENEIRWGRWVQQLVPSAEKMRFVSSGTEATLMALRLARIYTGKNKLLKFAGHFHGWNDYVVPGASPPYVNVTVPGIPDVVANNTILVPPNDAVAVENTLQNDDDVACVILEPTGGHMGAVPIRGEFLHFLRDITKKYNRLLIFDEVVTGFRVHPGGAQAHYDVTPDLTTLAKVLAGGLPGGCVAGREEILAYLEERPGKPKMNHPGTFNANPLSAAAGSAALEMVATGEPTQRANTMAARLKQKLNNLFCQRNAPWIAYGEFSVVKLLANYEDQRPGDEDFIPYEGDFAKLDAAPPKQLVSAFRMAMLLNGVDLPGLSCILTAAHTEEEIDKTVSAVENSLNLLANEDIG